MHFYLYGNFVSKALCICCSCYNPAKDSLGLGSLCSPWVGRLEGGKSELKSRWCGFRSRILHWLPAFLASQGNRPGVLLPVRFEMGRGKCQEMQSCLSHSSVDCYNHEHPAFVEMSGWQHAECPGPACLCGAELAVGPLGTAPWAILHPVLLLGAVCLTKKGPSSHPTPLYPTF